MNSQLPGAPRNPLLHADGISKDYARRRRPFYRREAAGEGDSLALANVSFHLGKGEAVGIIGRNGSGKSTLLKLLCRQLEPTTGTITGTDHIRALIELGTGMDVYQSGEENVKFFLRMQGMTERDLLDKSQQIHEFSELGSHYFQPVKTYSSGMFVRLAYAMHALSSADVLIVDEALAVGDAKFQHKCFTHIHKLKSAGTSIILVSHALDQVRQLCDRVLVLEGGRIVFDGDVNVGCDTYLNLLFKDDAPRDVDEERNNHNASSARDEARGLYHLVRHPLLYSERARYGSKTGMIEKLAVFADGVSVTGEISEGFGQLKIMLSGSLMGSTDLMLGLGIKSTEGVILYATNSFIDNIPLKFDPAQTDYCISMEVAVPLKAGNYYVDIGLCEIDGSTGGNPLDVIPSCLALTVKSRRSKINDGFLNLSVSYSKEAAND